MKTIKYLSMAALALVGAVMVGCSSDDNIIDEPQQPANKDNVVTLTTTISLDGAETRALSATGVKTFAAGETMALVYKSGTSTKKAVSHELAAGDITNEGKSATFTFDLEDPNRSGDVTYIYPAAMAKADGSVNYDDLYTEQDGTLTNLGSKFDYCTNSDAWAEGNLPSLTLDNQFAILALTLKNDAGGSDITSSITSLTLSDGTNSYTVSGHDADGHIYVAIRPTTAATIEVTATDGTKTYVKVLSSKSYAASNGYPLSWRMAEVIKGKFSVSSTKQVYFSSGNLQATKSGGTWSWHFGPNQYARVGNGVANTAITGNGTVSNGGNIDLFGWSTSTTHLGIHNSTTNTDYRTGSVTNGSDFVDWGSASEVTACIGTGWRTLNKDEWRYLTVTRSGNRFAKAQINDSRSGFILLPDNWNTSYYTLYNINNDKTAFSANNITSANWTSKLEANGAVFLPVTGQRSGTTVTNPDSELHYWSSSGGINSNSAPIGYHLRYIDSGTSQGLAPDAGAGRCNGFSVRLVRDVK